MNILIKFIIFFIFSYLWYKKKNIQLLLISLFFFIEICRLAFLEKLINKGFINILNIIQLSILIVVFILYVRRAITAIKNKN